MIRISEFLPNPKGKDTGLEWIEVWNSGDQPVSLSGWTIWGSSGKPLPLRGDIPADSLAVLRWDGGFQLRNKEGFLTLKNPRGEAVDKVGFLGLAPEGKSYSLIGEQFFFSEPSPGIGATPPVFGLHATKNPFTSSYDDHVLVDSIWAAFGAGLFFMVLIMVIIKKDDYLSNLFFSRN